MPTFAPYGSIQEYAVKLFENHGRGIGEKGKDNGLLVLLAVKDRKVWIEVGYGLEGFITDGFAGETSRQYMVPYFREGRYGDGLQAGVARFIARIAEGRNVSLDNRPRAAAPPVRSGAAQSAGIPFGLYIFIAIVIFNVLRSGFGGGRARRGGWGGGGWSGWSGGVGGSAAAAAAGAAASGAAAAGAEDSVDSAAAAAAAVAAAQAGKIPDKIERREAMIDIRARHLVL